MKVSTFMQPAQQLGHEVFELLESDLPFTRIVLVSAFVALRTILRLREDLLRHKESGAVLRVTAGVDLGGTSREALEEILGWDCEAFVFHNPNPRATFHPKVYLFEGKTVSTLFVGSNNLTDGGFYTNYEAATRYEFDLPTDVKKYKAVLKPLEPFLCPGLGDVVQALDGKLIEILAARGELPTEAEARRRSRTRQRALGTEETAPRNPFKAVATPLAPLLPVGLRASESSTGATTPKPAQREAAEPRPLRYKLQGTLIWRKTLPPSDALQVSPGTAHVGGVRLTQARFESPSGHRIDQTTYFRQIFADYAWERETGRHRSADQEHAFIPMRLVIRGTDYGILNFEVGHKPSGEAGQANYTTILRWGRLLNGVIQKENVTGAVLSLYELSEGDADFLIDITDPQ